VNAVLGPAARGVVVATAAPEDARRDRVWLEEAGFAAATPADLGLRLVTSVLATTVDLDDRVIPAMLWTRITRRPALVSLDEDSVSVETSARGRTSEREEAFESVEAALGERPPPRVTVFGGAWTPEDDADYGSARRFGKGLAAEGVEILCGGYQGIMAAVCRGAADAGVIGLTFRVTVAPWGTRATVNEWVDHVVEARDLFARLPVLADADAWVAFPGGAGTLQEVALCWNLVQNGLAEPRPLVVVGDRWGRLVESFRELLVVTDPQDHGLVRHVPGGEEALEVVSAVL
jgi:uncharacterized protein (TIGR00730 family)